MRSNSVVRARVHPKDADGRFPYTLTFESGSEHKDSVAGLDEWESVLAEYQVRELDVVFEGDSRRGLLS